MLTIDFTKVAAAAGFTPGADGKLNLPATQDTADRLARAAVDQLPAFAPGDPPTEAVLTGAGPVWGHLSIAHALHGRVARLRYAAPNADVVIWSHGL